MQQSAATGIFKYLKLRLFVIGREECRVFVTNTERQLRIILNAVPVVTEPNFRSETCQLKMNKQLRLWTSCTFWQQLHSRVHSWIKWKVFFFFKLYPMYSWLLTSQFTSNATLKLADLVGVQVLFQPLKFPSDVHSKVNIAFLWGKVCEVIGNAGFPLTYKKLHMILQYSFDALKPYI